MSDPGQEPANPQDPSPEQQAQARQVARARDAAARERVRTCFDRPLVLEAGAGTGKTATLIARLVTWAVRDGWRKAILDAVLETEAPRAIQQRASEEAIARRVLQRVVAITFTEKAAAEMAARFDEALQALVHHQDLVGVKQEQLGLDKDTLADRARVLLGVAHCLQVSTIHAFCRKLLADYPAAAGLHPAFEVDADLRRMRQLADEVLMEAFEASLGSADSGGDLEELISQGVDPAELSAALHTLVDQGLPASALEDDPYSAKRVAEVRGRLAARAGAVAEAAQAAFEDVGRAKGAQAVVSQSLRLQEALAAAQSVPELIAPLQDPAALKSTRNKLADWRKGKFSKTEEQCLEGRERALQAAATGTLQVLDHLARLDPARLPALCRVLSPMLAEVHRRARRRGIESFALLLRDARELLSQNDSVRGMVRQSLDLLLVDEFQDTDPVQCDLVEALALGDDDEGPQLFLVGDPKQSIYGWRDADLSAYEAFAQRVLARGGEKHSLTVNYRSVPAILDEVERLSTPIMHAEQGVQPAFEGLVAPESREHDAGCTALGRRPVEHWIAWNWERAADGGGHSLPGTSADEARQVEARAIALDVRQLVDGEKARYGDFALLMRSTTQQETYARALREAGVPYVVEKDRSWYQRREVLDATALARAVLDPADRLALVAWLRSPTVGLPDAVITALAAHGLLDSWCELDDADDQALRRLDEALDAMDASLRGLPSSVLLAGWRLMAKESLRLLGTLRRSLREEPADLFLQRLRHASLAVPTEGARYLGEHRVANLEVLLRDLREALLDDERPLAEVARGLRRVAEEEREQKADAPGDDSVDAVRLMTVHKSKGLSFEQVYLVNLHGVSGGPGGRPPDVAQAVGDRIELRLLGAHSLGFDLVQRRNETVERAEAIRLLYVASTRAKQRMVLAGAWPERPKSSVDSPLDLVRQRRGADPTEWARACEADEAVQGRVDEDGVRWRLPAADDQVLESKTQEAAPLDLEAARRDARQLESLRSKATAQAARAHSRPASSLGHELLRDVPNDGGDGEAGSPGSAAPDAPDAGRSDETSPPAPQRSPHDRELATALGTAVHRALEWLDLSAPLPPQMLAMDLDRLLDGILPLREDELAEALRPWLERLAGSSLLARLDGARDRVLARELPLLVRPLDTEPAVQAITGNIDLLLQDEDGALRIVDYKTDPVANASVLPTMQERYRPQAQAYLRAVRAAMPDTSVRFELWLLDADQVREID